MVVAFGWHFPILYFVKENDSFFPITFSYFWDSQTIICVLEDGVHFIDKAETIFLHFVIYIYTAKS